MKPGLNFINVYQVNGFCGETVPLSASSTSSNVLFNKPSSIKSYDVIITNAGTKTAFIGFGVGSATAAQLPGTNGTTNATPILGGEVLTLQKNTESVLADTCAAITSGADTTTLYFTVIQGS